MVDGGFGADLPGVAFEEPLFFGVEPGTTDEALDRSVEVVVRAVREVAGDTGVERYERVW